MQYLPPFGPVQFLVPEHGQLVLSSTAALVVPREPVVAVDFERCFFEAASAEPRHSARHAATMNTANFELAIVSLVVSVETLTSMPPNVRAKLPAEAGAVSLVRDDAPCAADQAYSACRSGSA
jgi:hypothetical protein